MSSSATENATDVVMPQMGVSVAEGTIAGWLKEVGDEIAADEPICEVTTDKIDVEIPAPVAGVLEEILVEEGETVTVGTPLARIGDGSGASSPAEEGSSDGASAPEPKAAAAADGEGGEIDRSEFYSPVVRRIAADEGVDLAAVEGHGVGGRVRKVDLLEHIERHGASGNGSGHSRPLHTESPYRPDPPPDPGPAAPEADRAPEAAPAGGGLDELVGPTRREAMDPMRKAIAEHMVGSRRTAAHCTTVVEADFSAVARDRAQRKPELARRGVSLTYLAYVARATVEGLQEHPVLNASVEDGEIVYHDDVNLGIAVALEKGLVVPVIRKAQRLSLEGLAEEIGELATNAREGRLAPDDVAGGTFTITNPGQFGAVIATPIINQPQVGILDLEAIVRRPVVVTDADGNESIGVRPMSYLCMSWDHRALDGAEAARFLAGLQARIEGVVS